MSDKIKFLITDPGTRWVGYSIIIYDLMFDFSPFYWTFWFHWWGFSIGPFAMSDNRHWDLVLKEKVDELQEKLKSRGVT